GHRLAALPAERRRAANRGRSRRCEETMRVRARARTAVIQWLESPQDHDYPAAESYLSLIYPPARARALVQRMKRTRSVRLKAKDFSRARPLSLLGVRNSHVERDQRKIASKPPLSPLLLVRDSTAGKVIVADGYHRLCAVYSHDEDALIPCRIV